MVSKSSILRKWKLYQFFISLNIVGIYPSKDFHLMPNQILIWESSISGKCHHLIRVRLLRLEILSRRVVLSKLITRGGRMVFIGCCLCLWRGNSRAPPWWARARWHDGEIWACPILECHPLEVRESAQSISSSMVARTKANDVDTLEKLSMRALEIDHRYRNQGKDKKVQGVSRPYRWWKEPRMCGIKCRCIEEIDIIKGNKYNHWIMRRMFVWRIIFP